MASSSAKKSQDSTTQIPPPFSLSPQLWISRRPKQPRTGVSLPLSSRNNIISELPTLPPALESDDINVANRYYITVSSKLCVDYIVPTATTFFSRDQLLRKMYKRRVQYRTYGTTDSVFNANTLDLFMRGVEICGPPFDCWMTFPIVQPPQPQQQEEVGDDPDRQEVEGELASGWIIGPVKCTREMLNCQVGMRFSSDGLKYPWVSHASSTKFHSLEKLIEIMGISKIDGFVQCVVCGQIMVVGFLLPTRFRIVLIHILERTANIPCDFLCNCEGGDNVYPMIPIISEDFNKIDWLFLFLAMGIGFCTVEQLTYYCKERKSRQYSSDSNKSTLIQLVYFDIISQLDPEYMFRELTQAQLAAA